MKMEKAFLQAQEDLNEKTNIVHMVRLFREVDTALKILLSDKQREKIKNRSKKHIFDGSKYLDLFSHVDIEALKQG